MKIPGIYADIHISSDTVRIYTLYVYKYIYEMFRSFYITTHLKVHTFWAFCTPPLSTHPRSTAAVFPSRSPGASLWKHDWPRSRRPEDVLLVGSLWNWGFLVGCFAPFSSKGFFGIHYLTCNDHGKCYCFWDGGRLKLWDNARLSWWNGTVLPVLGWKTHHSCRWWKKIRELS